MKNTEELENMTVINLDARRKHRAAWDKPLTTDFEKDRNKKLAPSSEVLETSREKRGLVLGFRHKVFRS